MLIVRFYRLYAAIAAGAAVYFLANRSVWLWIGSSILTRILWALVERAIRRRRAEIDFKRHIQAFKQQLGPYGIRIANMAENDPRIRQSLAEVFTRDSRELTKTVEQLEVMDTLFRAGMRPSGDEYLLHDCKLKYGKHRLETQQR